MKRTIPPPAKGFRHLVTKLVSGGQTGADRAALDWTIAHNIEHGGWCPKGRKAEDGPLEARYRLTETESGSYAQRTKRNIRDSDGTLIVNLGALEGGSLRTVRLAAIQRKPHRVVQMDGGVKPEIVADVLGWVRDESIRVLNVAGPRESKRPGIYNHAWALLEALAEPDSQQP